MLNTRIHDNVHNTIDHNHMHDLMPASAYFFRFYFYKTPRKTEKITEREIRTRVVIKKHEF